jgi:hypothetical protein
MIDKPWEYMFPVTSVATPINAGQADVIALAIEFMEFYSFYNRGRERIIYAITPDHSRKVWRVDYQTTSYDHFGRIGKISLGVTIPFGTASIMHPDMGYTTAYYPRNDDSPMQEVIRPAW